MKVIYHVFVCHNEVGEVEGMFDSDGKLIDLWAANDGVWRDEYFNPFIEKLGYKICDPKVPALRKSLSKALIEAAKKAWGL